MKLTVVLLLSSACLLAFAGCAKPKVAAQSSPGRANAASQPATGPDDDPTGPVRARPQEKIAEADALMLSAMTSYRKLQGADRMGARAYKPVLEQLLRLIREYPQSDKTDDAYFYAAELLKEYCEDDATAIEYYRRAYQIDPSTPHPARFQRAVLLDFRMNDRAGAIKEYRNAIRSESGLGTPWARSNTDFATIRLRQLEGKD
ncbi:MAG: hypothetical protein PHU85_01550 [Phycisphaerae bacterium]|nr:hypothetical protein [Phycisphaerae bacterium]